MQERQCIARGRLVGLAEMQEEDQPHFYRWLLEQPTLRAIIDDTGIPSMKKQTEWFRRVREPDRTFFSLVTVPDGVLIGNVGLVDIDPVDRSAQFRITIGSPEHRGKGLGREATELMLRHGFEEMQLKRIWLKVRSDNAPARALYEKVGFRPIGGYPKQDGHGPGIIMEIRCS